MPANFKDTYKTIKILPKDKVYILDQLHEDLLGYPAIYQNFKKDIYDNLMKVEHLIKKYKKLNFILTDNKQPTGMLEGFIMFCKKQTIPYVITKSLKEYTIEDGELFIIPDNKSLLKIIKKAKSQRFILSEDIGIISYNDTLLKEIVEGGITTISTDFYKMGKRLAKMILNKENIKIENPNSLIIRNSL
jgi:DNA-binding LacI/PurR family transcriptional regulator